VNESRKKEKMDRSQGAVREMRREKSPEKEKFEPAWGKNKIAVCYVWKGKGRYENTEVTRGVTVCPTKCRRRGENTPQNPTKTPPPQKKPPPHKDADVLGHGK